jgi:secondary thiamine-phosphate synthase enzyme
MDHKTVRVATAQRCEFIDVTGMVTQAVSESGIEDGICTVFIPHTTAGVTINENADPDVLRDISYWFDSKIPWKDSSYRHAEGNSAAHVKSSLVGSSVNVIISSGRLLLGTWQSVFFCEFDGPRTRNMMMKIMEG